MCQQSALVRPRLGSLLLSSNRPWLGSLLPSSNRLQLGSLLPSSNRPRLGSLLPSSNRPRLGSLLPSSNRLRLGSLLPSSNRPRLSSVSVFSWGATEKILRGDSGCPTRTCGLVDKSIGWIQWLDPKNCEFNSYLLQWWTKTWRVEIKGGMARETRKIYPDEWNKCTVWNSHHLKMARVYNGRNIVNMAIKMRTTMNNINVVFIYSLLWKSFVHVICIIF